MMERACILEFDYGFGSQQLHLLSGGCFDKLNSFRASSLFPYLENGDGHTNSTESLAKLSELEYVGGQL